MVKMIKELTIQANKNEISLICEALSNRKRLRIIELIKTLGDELSHSKLADKLGVRSSSISFHLAPLIDAGIISENISKGLKGRNKKVPILNITKIVIEL